jgi:hypothetical protein
MGRAMTVTSATIASSIGLRLRYLAQCIHDLGPNPLYQMMCELSTSSAAMDRFERYGRLALCADLIEANGGRNLPTVIRAGASEKTRTRRCEDSGISRPHLAQGC